MSHTPTPEERLSVLQRITLEMISSLDLESVLSAITRGLIDELGADLARIWLLGPGDLCSVCHKAKHCAMRDQCLHLSSTAGLSENLDGLYRRVPIGAFKIGRIAETHEPAYSRDVQNDPRIQNRAWAVEHGLHSFAGYPLIFRGEILGVLGFFTRHRLADEDFEHLAIFANQAAIAIENARLFAENAGLNKRLVAENVYLQEEIQVERSFGEIIGSSAALGHVLSSVRHVAPTEASVLIQGETGTGKELIARAVHRLSGRSERPLIKVDCGAISAGLVESELFGHEKGAFTGAHSRRVGRFGLADGGTIFLDEVGELPPDTQVKLLRVLQNGAFERVGSSRTERVDVRVVAATNRDLAVDVSDGRFRSDLFYRLNVFPILVPPLRERREDIEPLAEHFLSRFAVEVRKPLRRLSAESARRAREYDWPGNVRELRNVVERAAILARSPVVDIVPDRFVATPARASAMGRSMEDVERKHILRALESCGWVIQGERGAARDLGLKPSTLRSRMQKLGIQRPR